MKRIVAGVLAVGFCAASVAAETLATVGGKTITRAEVEEHVRPSLVEIENTRYQVLNDGLNELIGQALLAQEAKARGVTVADLVEKEIAAKIQAPTDAEIQKLFEENKEALGNAPFESIQERLAEYLRQQRGQQRQGQFIAELKKKYPTQVQLRPPVVEIDTAGMPARGGGDGAPVTIVEFSDYECPFCKRAEESVHKVLAAYGDKVRLVYRHYPLPFHPNARPAAEASHCAHEQGKFWEYHDKLMAAEDLSRPALQTYAKELGLDVEAFDKCVDSGKFKSAVEKDIAAAGSAGVSGTPAFFINGRLLDGAQPFEKFKEVIDEELARAKQG